MKPGLFSSSSQPLIQAPTVSFTPTQFYTLLSQGVAGSPQLRLLDVILISPSQNEKRPYSWLFTDTRGHLNVQPLTSMKIEDLVKAVISNVEGGRPVSHEDILRMLASYGNQMVCFGLTRKRGRIPLSIGQLVNIKQEIINDLEGIQLYRFTPFVYYYDVHCKDRKGESYHGYLVKTSLSDPQTGSDESGPAIQGMAEEATRAVLDILGETGHGFVCDITLIFALEEGGSPQLWLLGTSRLVFYRKTVPARAVRRKINRENHQTGKREELFMLLPRGSLAGPTTGASRAGTGTHPETAKLIKPALLKLEQKLNRGNVANIDLKPRNMPGTKQRMQLLIRSYRWTLERRNSQGRGGILPKKETDPQGASRASRAVSVERFGGGRNERLSRSCVHRPNAMIRRRTPLGNGRNGGLNERKAFATEKENATKRLRDAIEVLPARLSVAKVAQDKKEALRYAAQRRSSKDHYGYEPEDERAVHAKSRYCAGDFCGLRDRPEDSGPLYQSVDELLIQLGRTQTFSPVYNPDIAKGNDFPQHYNNDPVQTKRGSEEATILAQVRSKVAAGKEGSSLPPDIVALIKGSVHPRLAEVCPSCREAYTKIAKYLWKLVMGEDII